MTRHAVAPESEAGDTPRRRVVVAHEPEPGAVEVPYRPLYARALGLRHLQPGGMLCFVYLEGSIALSLLLALAELVSWWVVLILPVSVALMVKVNDLVAGAVARSAARTPERERERLRREVVAFMPMVGRASVVTQPKAAPAQPERPAANTATAQPERLSADTATAQLEKNTAPAQPERPAANTATAQPERLTANATTAQLEKDTAPAQLEKPAASSAADQPEEPAAEPAKSADQEHVDGAGQRDTAGRYAAAGRYLDAAWRQHAYAVAHEADRAEQPTQRERQSASRRYE